jgi:FG-GAP repeat
MKSIISIAFFIFLNLQSVFAQNNVGIKSDGSLPDSSAKLDIQSTTQGILLPRLTTAQRNSMPKKAQGLLVYDIDKQTLYLYSGDKWNPLAAVTNAELQAITTAANPSNSGDFFGSAVTISGDWAAIGALGYDLPSKQDCGAVYLFKRNNSIWEQVQIITATDAAASNNFGCSVDMDGNRLIIGAKAANTATKTNAGAAYIFQNSADIWSQETKLQPGDADNYDYFGTSVTIDAGYAVVGSPYDDVSATDQGSAYVYRYFTPTTSWVFDKKLLGTLPTSGEQFGKSVSLSGVYAVIGVPGFNNGAGLVYIFNKNDFWTSTDYINPFLPANSKFGASVCIDGFYLAIGAPNETVNNITGAGRVSVYLKYINWTNIGSISPLSLQTGDNFGAAVSFANGFLIAGAPNRIVNGNVYQGEAFLYKQNGIYPANVTWEYKRKITINNGNPYEYFGNHVGIGGFNIITSSETIQSGRGKVVFLNIEE